MRRTHLPVAGRLLGSAGWTACAAKPHDAPVTASPPIPITQATVRPGFIEFSIGQPDPALLPADALAEAAASALRRYGADALGYGAEAGPPPLVEWIREHLGRIDARAPADGELMATAGNSHALDLVATVFARPGDVALVEVPTYHLALGILRDHGLDLVGVDTDADGLIPEAVEQAAQRVAANGGRVSLLYTIPTFGNPTGRTMPVERRAALIDIARRHGVLIVEDDVYRELWFTGEPPPSIGSLAGDGPVVRLGSFSKTLAPGLRLGWLTGARQLVRRVLDAGVLDSGGGLNPMVGLTVAEFAAAGRYEPNVAFLRATYAARRDALVDALREAIPEAEFAVPDGGYFVWLRLPGGLDARALAPAGEAAGVTFVPASRFDASATLDPAWLRLAYTRFAEADLADGAQRLGAVVRHALG